MENQNEPLVIPTTRSVGMKYGLILGVIAVAYFTIMMVMGVDMQGGFGRWGGLIFDVIIIYMAHKAFKDDGDGYMSIGQGTTISFWIALIGSGISSVFTFVYIKFIDNSFVQQILDKQREEFESQGMSDNQIDQAMEMTAKFTTPTMMLIFGLIGGLVIVTLIGLLISLFTQKKNPDAIA